MSERERVIQLLNSVPDDKIAYIIGYIQGLTINREEELNEETMAAMDELKNGGGEIFRGSTEEFFDVLLED